MTGITSIALARPSLVVGAKEIAEAWGRTPRGVEHVRVPAWDEDATTLAIDAAAAALGREPGAALRALVLAGPIDGGVVAESLGARHARVLSISDAPLAGLDALAATLRSTELPALCVAATVPSAPLGSDARIEEGAGAAAFLVTADGALRLLESAAHARAASPPGELDAEDPLRAAASRLMTPSDAPLFVVGASGVLSSPKPVRPSVDARKEWGELRAVAPLVQLAESLRQGAPKGGWCLVADASPARALALALKVEGDGALALAPASERARRVSPTRALAESRALAALDPSASDSPMGAYVPAGTWLEDLPARLRLAAQRCVACGRVQYPPRGACLQCGAREFGELELPRAALVHAATRIGRGGAPSEFAPEQAQTGAYWVGVVEWPEQGVRVTARLGGYDEHGPAIGDSVRAVVRRLFEQEGSVRYGTKFEPT